MKINKLRIGILHSIIGKNDGVSIVIDDTVDSMIKDMKIPLGNIFFLSAHSPARFNVTTDEIFWHKNEINMQVVKYFSGKPPKKIERKITKHADYAARVIRKFVEQNRLDLLIAHNTSHIYNFISAVGLGMYLEQEKEAGRKPPKVIVWWHDSYFEREQFNKPNKIIGKYLKYLPGTYVDGIIFINSLQPEIAKHYFKMHKAGKVGKFFKEKTCIIPNTCKIPWKWKKMQWDSSKLIFPPQDQYNRTFFKDIGILKELDKRNMTIGNAVLLLQHTRVVPRKNIELAINFAFMLAMKFGEKQRHKCVVLLVSGPSGDEQNAYKINLKRYFNKKCRENSKVKVVLIFGEDKILSEKEIIVDKKYYRFYDIPSIIASAGGIGVYFSKHEGYGNNLLEMIRFALPVVVNKYEIYKKDIEKLGFDLPGTEDGQLNHELVEQAYNLLTDHHQRNALVKHNLEKLNKKLNQKLISQKLNPIIKKAFK